MFEGVAILCAALLNENSVSMPIGTTTKKVTFHDMYNGTKFDFSCIFWVKDRAMLYPSP